MEKNPGHMPECCIILDEDGEVAGWHPVHVRLFNGYDTRAYGASPWPAFGARIPTNWRISRPPHPFEIEFYEVA